MRGSSSLGLSDRFFFVVVWWFFPRYPHCACVWSASDRFLILVNVGGGASSTGEETRACDGKLLGAAEQAEVSGREDYSPS